MKKWIFAAAAAVILAGVGYQLYMKTAKKKGKTQQRQAAPAAVEAEPVKRSMLKDIGEFSGSLMPGAQFVVSPMIGGRLEVLHVDVGDRVKKGELIAELDDDEASQQVEQANAELEVATASIEDTQNGLLLAEREHERARALRDKQIASESELERAQAALRAAEARHRIVLALVRQRKAALNSAEFRLSYTKVRATWNSGNGTRVVGERYADEGALLKANDPIVSVLDIDTLFASIQVIEQDYPRVREGQKAVVTTDLFPGIEFSAKVARVAPLLREEARQAEVRVDVPNPGELLKPGMFVRVNIEYARKDGAPSVPAAALTRRNGEQGVFLVDGDGKHVRFVPVSVGLLYGGRAEIVAPPLSGLVVTLGHHLLEDGAPVHLNGETESPRRDDAKAAGRSER